MTGLNTLQADMNSISKTHTWASAWKRQNKYTNNFTHSSRKTYTWCNRNYKKHNMCSRSSSKSSNKSNLMEPQNSTPSRRTLNSSSRMTWNKSCVLNWPSMNRGVNKHYKPQIRNKLTNTVQGIPKNQQTIYKNYNKNMMTLRPLHTNSLTNRHQTGQPPLQRTNEFHYFVIYLPCCKNEWMNPSMQANKK
jgi:hypothetical protein